MYVGIVMVHRTKRYSFAPESKKMYFIVIPYALIPHYDNVCSRRFYPNEEENTTSDNLKKAADFHL